MIYTFKCDDCQEGREFQLPASECESVQRCECGGAMHRDFMADWQTVRVDTSGCKDANKIPERFQVRSMHDRGTPEQIEKRFAENVQHERELIATAGNKRSSFRKSHAIPSHIVHGKVKQTGDKDYWKDPKNLAKHSDWKVS